MFQSRRIGRHLIDHRGSARTAALGNEGGNVVRELRAGIAAEAGARQTYEALIRRCEDAGSKKVRTRLLTREVTRADLFMKVLGSIGKLGQPLFGSTRQDATVNVVFILS
jgi:Mn-containing catalase